MPLESVTGSISNSCNKAQVTWLIEINRGMGRVVNYFHESPEFHFLGNVWCLRIYLNGDSESVGWISLCLVMKDWSRRSITYTLSIKDGNQQIRRGPVTRHTFDENNNGHGWNRIFRKSEMIPYKGYPFSFEISCEATEASLLSDAACQTILNSCSIFDRDFRDLLSSGRKSDVTFEVQGSEFKAHKWILEASSPVFDVMFATDMREKNEGIVKISDCDPDTFQNFLRCVYSGRVENLSPDNVIKLYKIAHKYSVDGLKEKCAEIMAVELSLDVVCEVLDLAYKHSETRLLNCAKEFLFQNIKTVLPTDKWRWFMAENGTLASSIVTNHVLCS